MADERRIQRERAQNLWVSFGRKFPLMAKAAQFDPSPEVSFDQIGGLAGPKEELLTYACAATHPEVYGRWGTFPPSGLLLLGQRSVGKALLAKALSTSTESAFLHINVPRLVVQLLHTAGNLAELITAWSPMLSEMPTLTVLFDELEFFQAQELGVRRHDLPVGPVMDFLLDLVDYTIAVKSTLVVGSTTHPDTLRRAFVTPGRFERVVEVNPVFPDDHVAALKIHAAAAEKRADHPLFEDLSWSDLVHQYREASTGDWIRLLHAALRRKARCDTAGEDSSPLRTADLLEELERLRRAHARLPTGSGGIYL